METSSGTDRLAKLPPPPPSPGSFTSIQRKSFVKHVTNGAANSPNNESETTTFVRQNVRRVPIHRSISTTPEGHQHLEQQSSLPKPRMSPFDSLTGSGLSNRPHLNGSLDSFSAIDLANSALRSVSSRLAKSALDRYSSSSGYDSNSSSSQLFRVGSSSAGSSTGPGAGVTSSSTASSPLGIRRIPSLHSFYHYSPSSEASSETATKKSDSQASLRTKRHSYSEKSIKEEVIRSLDRLEKRVAFLREVASELSEEKRKLVDALAQIEACCTSNTFTEVDLQDIHAASDLLRNRLTSVDILLKTNRSPGQADALTAANQYIDELGQVLNRAGKMAAKQRCLSYISSCSSDNLTDRENGSQVLVPIDEKFQKMVIQCSLEDQKAIKRKLEAILLNIEK